TVGRHQRRDIDTSFAQRRHPTAVGTQFRVAPAAQREQPGHAPMSMPTSRRGEARLAWRTESTEAVLHVEANTTFLEATHEGAQQRPGLHVPREHATGASDDGVEAQFGGEGTQILGPEALQPAANRRLCPIATAI